MPDYKEVRMQKPYNIEDISYTITEYCPPGPCRYCSIWKLEDKRDEELTSAELDSVFSSKHLNLKKKLTSQVANPPI